MQYRRSSDFEADIILLYPSPDGKIHVVLIDVKRSTDPGKLSEGLITEALVQLKKDTHFILQLLQDVPAEKLKIETFIALPEAEDNVVEEMFNEHQIPTSFMGNVLTKTDFTTNKLKDKLNLDYCQSEEGRENINFLSACARIRGNQNQKLSYKNKKTGCLSMKETLRNSL